MLVNGFHRLAVWLTGAFRQRPTDGAAQATPSVFDFDPMWHGDHWQNLLSSPMDARHYVMEDWSIVNEVDLEPAGLATQIRENGLGKSGAKKKRDWEVAPTKVWRSFSSTKKSASESRDFSIQAKHQMIGGAIGNHLLRLQQQSIFSFFSRCFFTSFDVAIEQRVVIDTASPYPTDARKAFPSKASIDIANNCASSNTLLRKSERPPGNHIPTLCLSGNERA